MKIVKFEHLGKTPSEALSNALKDGFTLARESAHTHFIVEHVLEEHPKWKVVLRVIYKPGTSHHDGDTHFFIRQRDEHAYLSLKKNYKFDYVHVIEKGAFWDTILNHHPNLDLYDAVNTGSGDDESGSTTSGFIIPSLTKKPKQAFTGKMGHGPSI